MKRFYDFLFLGIKENLQYLYEDMENIEAIIIQHKQIFDAIASRSSEKAFAAMQGHIRFVMDFIRNRNAT
jgi:DNA-binding FadR family transcriptional regulator